MIKNKDGSEYKLRTPNPLMSTQNLDGEKLIIHNLNPEEIVGEDHTRQQRMIPNPFAVIDLEQSVEEFMEIKEPPKKPERIEGKKLIAWCLPAFVKEEVNPLYDELKKSIHYGEKFSFETMVISRNILTCEFWSPVKIEQNSILYLWEQREWWKVSKDKEYQNGFSVTCYPSEYQPSF